MGCFGRNRKQEFVLAEHKFAYINMNDYTSKSFINYVAYGWIYVGTLVSVACYAADIYTAVILLAFNRWTNDTLEKSGIIDFDVARIVFSVCIFFSIVLLAIDWFRAIRVIKSDGVAEAYMDLIAVGFNCIWGGKGKEDTGWKRFLVFSRLTKSRGVVDYLALFTYFAFKGWVRIIFAEGPRVVINALTFISVTQADVIVHSGQWDGWDKFGKNVQALYDENKLQVMILGTMAFTSLFWVMAVLRLLLAAIIYVVYLWHTMTGTQSLSKYCKERIDTRMGEIVQKKHDKAIQREKKQGTAFIARQPTIPVLAPTRNPTVGRVVASNPMSSSANLIPRSNTLVSNTPPPSYMSREPKLPFIQESGPAPPARALTRGPGNAPVGVVHQSAPSRSGTMRTHISYESSASSRDYQQSVISDHRMQPQQPYYDPTVDSGYLPQPVGGQRRMEEQHSGYAGDGEYHQLQPLQPGQSGRSTFVMDRLARNNTVGGGYDNGQPPVLAGQGGRGRFPIRPREPVDQQLGGWGAPPPGPRRQTAGLQQMYRAPQPGPRSQTAGPMEGRYGLPPQNLAPQMRGYGAPPPRSRTAGPSEGAYGPPPVGNTVVDRMDGGYGGGAPPRSHTAAPSAGAYDPPLRSQSTAPAAGAYGPPPRSHTAAPTAGAYGPPPRSRTAAPRDDSYALPPINTAVGLDDGFHTPPPPPIKDTGYTTPQSGVSNSDYSPSRTMTAVAIEGGYGTPPRGQREYSRDSGQSSLRDREEQLAQPLYAGKPTFRPPPREQSRSPPVQVQDYGLEEFGPPRRSRTAPVEGGLEARNTTPPPPRSETVPPPPPTTMRGGFDGNGGMF